MIITIEGNQGEGKTTLAREISKGKKVIFIDEYELKNKSWLSDLAENKDTGVKVDFLVIDGIANTTNIEEMKLYLSACPPAVRRPYVEKMIKVELPPNIILIKQGKN